MLLQRTDGDSASGVFHTELYSHVKGRGYNFHVFFLQRTGFLVDWRQLSERQNCAIVVLTNGFHGMTIMPDLIGAALPGLHPSFSWLGYPVLSGR